MLLNCSNELSAWACILWGQGIHFLCKVNNVGSKVKYYKPNQIGNRERKHRDGFIFLQIFIPHMCPQFIIPTYSVSTLHVYGEVAYIILYTDVISYQCPEQTDEHLS